MSLSICFNVKVRPVRRVRNVGLSKTYSDRLSFCLKVVVFAHKGPRSNGGFSWGDKPPRRNYVPTADELGDISVLYGDEPIVGDTSELVHDCTMHISNFIYNRNILKAHRVFDLMIERDVPPNEHTYIAPMKGYTRMRRKDEVFELLQDMGIRGVIPTEKTRKALTNAFAKTGDIFAALSVFHVMKTLYGVKPNTISYNVLLKSCVKKKNLKAAKTVLKHMATSKVSKDVITLTIVIDIYAECCNKENATQYLKECRDLVDEIDKDGFKANVFSFNTLLKLCARGSLTKEAFDILDEMKTKGLNPDIVTYSILIDGLSKNETLSTEEVLNAASEVIGEVKKEGLQLDAQAYRILLHLAYKTRDLNRAVGLFHEMKELGIKPTSETYGTMIKCYEKLGDPSTGDVYLKPCLDLLTEREQRGIKMDARGYTSLLSACANASNLDAALEVWSRMIEAQKKPDVFVYNAMISVYLNVDEEDQAFDLFDGMKTSGVKPNEVTYTTFIVHFMKKKDRSGAQRTYNVMKSLAVQPDKDTLQMLKALGISWP